MFCSTVPFEAFAVRKSKLTTDVLFSGWSVSSRVAKRKSKLQKDVTQKFLHGSRKPGKYILYKICDELKSARSSAKYQFILLFILVFFFLYIPCFIPTGKLLRASCNLKLILVLCCLLF